MQCQLHRHSGLSRQFWGCRSTAIRTPSRVTISMTKFQKGIGLLMKKIQMCGAFARSTGHPCQAKALVNGRCKNHGGMSTGPKTPEGRQAIAQATRQRMASGQQERALEGFYRWLEGGGREMLSSLAKQRFKRLQVMRLKACPLVPLPVTCLPLN